MFRVGLVCTGIKTFCFEQAAASGHEGLLGDVCYAAEYAKFLSVTFVTMMRFVLTVVNVVGIIFLHSGERLKTG